MYLEGGEIDNKREIRDDKARGRGGERSLMLGRTDRAVITKNERR